MATLEQVHLARTLEDQVATPVATLARMLEQVAIAGAPGVSWSWTQSLEELTRILEHQECLVVEALSPGGPPGPPGGGGGGGPPPGGPPGAGGGGGGGGPPPGGPPGAPPMAIHQEEEELLSPFALNPTRAMDGQVLDYTVKAHKASLR